MTMRRVFIWIALLLPAFGLRAEEPFLTAELIFPLEHWHNHSSSIVELPNGDLFVAWFHGSGERTADDVVIRGARWIRTTGRWTKPFLLADTPASPTPTACSTWTRRSACGSSGR